MNTASRDRALLPAVQDVLPRRTPISKLKLSKDKDGQLRVALHTSRPNNVRMHTEELTSALKEEIGGDRVVRVEIVPEARAVAKFVRTSPRKARLVIDAIKGKRVSEALAILRFIPNHAAEHITKVLSSAAANAMDGWGQGVEELKIVNILADGGPSLKRVRARAQGRAYRILKRTCHLTVILTDAPPEAPRPRRVAKAPKAKAAPAPAALPAKSAAPKAEVAAEAPAAETETKAAETVPAETPAAEPQGATPVTASDAPEEDTSDAKLVTDEPGEGE
jgi:large subunit ribosomal protein L22